MTQSLFIFRRDLRVFDNTGLLEAARGSDRVTPCFIFDESLLARCEQNNFRLAFLHESLADLDRQLQALGSRLNILVGKPTQLLAEILAAGEIDNVYVNRDYTPLSRRRDEALAAVCNSHGAGFHTISDALLNEPEQVYKGDGGHYAVFTPFYNRARQLFVAPPQSQLPTNLSAEPLSVASSVKAQLPVAPTMTGSVFTSGRTGALQVLGNLAPLENYANERDFPAMQGTSRLSAHLRFGTCSIREAYQSITAALGEQHPMLRQLYWRDFYTHIAYYRPRVFGHAFRGVYDAVVWDRDQSKFEQWCAGQTGFPIVDAGMRELTSTGYMHNRVRMVVASFLVKNLHLDWRWGEAFFKQYLVDFDPCVNNGSWQWAASTGADAQPYFRVFNPWRQQLKFDSRAQYIKRWVPELADWDPKAVHRLEKDP
ncbi:MAG: deoxyribodipyrimidine photo-lyase, partial [Crocinitomicaceae bacterium]